MSAAVQSGPSRRDLWRDIWQLLREFWAAHPLAVAASVALLVVGNARVGMYIAAMGGLIDALVGGSPTGRSGLFWVGVYVVASAMEQFYWAAKVILSSYLTDHGIFRIQRRVLARAAAAPLIQLEEGAFFDHLQRASTGMGERLQRLSSILMDLVQVVVMLVSVGAALYFVHPLLLPLLALGTPLSVWLQMRVATVVYQVQRDHTTRDRMRTHIQSVLTGREAAPEVRLFGTPGYLLDRWRTLRTERARDMLAAEGRRARFSTASSLIAGIAYAAALVFVAVLIAGGQVSVGGYVSVATGAIWFQSMLGGLIQVTRALEEESRFLGDLFEFGRVARAEGAPPAAAPRRGHGMAVEAEGLTFAYPGRPEPVIDNVSLSIRPGERIAIVGENGAGKTTLAKLLVGLYTVGREGAVRLDGEPLVEGQMPGARSRIGAVFQDYASFQLTARENVGFGDLSRMQDDSAIAAAAERAGIAGVITELSGGIDAYLGRQFGDTELSGGQWQRVALARAFMRDADLLVLDEPTAALDPLAELALFERFVELVEGRTAIMISHRLGAARLADRILVLAHGRIVEEGSHAELVSLGGEYARLFATQAQWYR